MIILSAKSVLREDCKGYIVNVTESVAYQVIFANCLSQNPNKQGMSAQGLLTQTMSKEKPVQSTFYDVNCLLHIA